MSRSLIVIQSLLVTILQARTVINEFTIAYFISKTTAFYSFHFGRFECIKKDLHNLQYLSLQ